MPQNSEWRLVKSIDFRSRYGFGSKCKVIFKCLTVSDVKTYLSHQRSRASTGGMSIAGASALDDALCLEEALSLAVKKSADFTKPLPGGRRHKDLAKQLKISGTRSRDGKKIDCDGKITVIAMELAVASYAWPQLTEARPELQQQDSYTVFAIAQDCWQSSEDQVPWYDVLCLPYIVEAPIVLGAAADAATHYYEDSRRVRLVVPSTSIREVVNAVSACGDLLSSTFHPGCPTIVVDRKVWASCSSAAGGERQWREDVLATLPTPPRHVNSPPMFWMAEELKKAGFTFGSQVVEMRAPFGKCASGNRELFEMGDKVYRQYEVWGLGLGFELTLFVLQAFFYDGTLYKYVKTDAKNMHVSKGCMLSSLKGAKLSPCSRQVAFELGTEKLPLPQHLDEKKFSAAWLVHHSHYFIIPDFIRESTAIYVFADVAVDLKNAQVPSSFMIVVYLSLSLFAVFQNSRCG